MKNIVMMALIANATVYAGDNAFYQTMDVSVANGKMQIEQSVINGPATPPLNVTRTTASSSELEVNKQASSGGSTIHILTAPAFSWSFGCAATTAAMIAGYYDRMGYPNVYTGPTNSGVMPLDNSSWGTMVDSGGDERAQCPLSATRDGLDGRVGRGHVDDYWIKYDNSDDDPFVTNGWDEHAYGDCTGDFMKTNQTTNYGNSDGATTFYSYDSADPLTAAAMESYNIQDKDGAYGFKLFFESRGYNVPVLYTQKIDAQYDGGFSFEQYKKEIDAGRPVMINLAGHTVAGVGYDASNNTVYLHDTWDYDTHTMTWGGSYAGMDQISVSILNLEPVATQNDFNGDGIADILFRDSISGKNTIFFQAENGSRASYAYTTTVSTNWEAVGIGDFDGNHISDILFRNLNTGKNMISFQSADGGRTSYAYTTSMSSAWDVAGVGDFNKDGISDILFRNSSTGKNLIFFQNQDGSRASYAHTTSMSSAWDVAGVGDFNKDGISDILFRNSSTGKNLIFFQNQDGSRASYAYTTSMSSAWDVAGVADFNGDDIADILFRNAGTGKNLIFFQNADGSRASYAYTASLSSSWDVASVADFNRDDIADILFRNSATGKNVIFFQNADGSRASYDYTTKMSESWSVVK
ncbi:FG-GAP-like repeat-containing protein [Sulfurovum sp.]|uniref:FG-GAP-like repeat-containing protein n=1 Tax=Sulfurovum sp. TaxID=1969726 RepID=UPI0025DE2E0A|nr:FG-GAP-like repeat-containing protein [Sulfurovum sp.]